MKRFRTVLHTVLAGMVLWAAHTYAVESAPWRGSIKSPGFNGNTYTITSADELAWVAEQSRTDDFAGKVIRLEADIDLGGTQDAPSSNISSSDISHNVVIFLVIN